MLKKTVRLWWGVVAFLIVFAVGLAGCAAKEGPAGPAGSNVGTLSGVVTNSLTKQAVSGVNVTFNPAAKEPVTTSATGEYKADLPIGIYKVTYAKGGFTSATQDAIIVAAQSVKADIALVPAAKVAVNAGADASSTAGASVSLKATVEPMDGSTVSKVEWKQTAGVPAQIDNAASQNINVKLSDNQSYRKHFLDELKLKERFDVQGINPFDLEEGSVATFAITATTSSGVYKDSVNVAVPLPYVVSLGIRNVPVGEPVLLNGKTQSAYSWSVSGPSGSKVSVNDAATRNPSFTPDVAGKYVLTESTGKATVEVTAGTWSGGITGLDATGRPEMAACTGCHNGTQAPNAQFTDWKKSGHAEIFTQNINDPAGHWAITCAPCHTVGYSPNVANGGFDEAVKAENWQVPPHGEVGLYTSMLKNYPKTAGLANVQCESCHGPNNSALHANGSIDAARMSISSDVCGSCHGEPLRHGRFQQWAESRHAGTDTTPARGVNNAHCGRCHSTQGFLAWIKQPDLTLQIQGAKGTATAAEMTALGMGADTIEPVTCVACHDPHAQGTVSGEPNTASVRIIDDTKLLPSGFKASVVGEGALCMTCHNTRNLLHNPENLPTSFSAPHTAAQGDVLMGQNAYFVEPGERSPHSYIKDTCVTCHLQSTPPPALLSYNRAGTNHSFAADMTICKDCHSATLNGEALQAGIHEKIEELGEAMAAYLLKKMPAVTTVLDYTPHQVGGKSYDVLSGKISLDKANIASMVPAEPHGQQGFLIHLKNPIDVTYSPAGEAPHTVSMKELEVRLGDFTSDGAKTLVTATDPLVLSGWNFFLIEGDGSFGIHNPTFSMEVLEASIAALQ